ncbi:uncharacterized protein [Procambarus clarkii]|uniref:uncharacterized protein n=1 Tax=Procambarus clarkii TaxID=6728 RepID=UPI003742065C
MMRVLAVTLGRSSRPRHHDHDDHSPAPPIAKDDVRSLISEQPLRKAEDPDPGILRRGVVRSANVKYCQDFSSSVHGSRSRESTQTLITVEPSKAKSARVTRIPKETMSAHRSKLVRNSSISKWRAKFRRPPLASDQATETDTEQLLEPEENAKPRRKTDGKVSRDANYLKSKIRSRISDASSNSCSSNNEKNKKVNIVTKNRNQEKDLGNNSSKNRSAIREEVAGWMSQVQSSEICEARAGVPPPRSLTPHRVQLGGHLIPWVESPSHRDSDSPYYLAMCGGQVPANHQRVSGSSLPNKRSYSSAAGRIGSSAERQMGSWPRPSRISDIRDAENGHMTPPQKCPRAVCAPNLPDDLGGSVVPRGSYSHFGTFPRRRPAHKAIAAKLACSKDEVELDLGIPISAAKTVLIQTLGLDRKEITDSQRPERGTRTWDTCETEYPDDS